MKERDSGTTDLVFTVTLSAPAGDGAAVEFATEDGTASTADGDYDGASGILAFPVGAIAQTIHVPVHGDMTFEGNEWFTVRLSNPSGMTFDDSVAVGTIVNDERTSFTHHVLGQTDYRSGTLPTAMGDFNNDGYLDYPLFFGGPTPPYPEIPGFRTLLADGNYHGVSACDYDRDGDLDLVILGYRLDERGTADLVLRNRGDGTFDNLAPILGMAVSGNSETAVWADFDGDGWPDLFAPYYTDRYPFQSFLYHNNGDGTFTDRAAEAGISVPGVPWNVHPEGAEAADWNDDGYIDLYCAGHLFINDGTAHFTDVRAAVGLPEKFDEGASLVDYDNDGDLDLYLRCLDSPHLFRNDGGHFTEVTAESGILGTTLFWGDSWADVDNDGDLDLVQHGSPKARLLLNQGDGTFERDSSFEAVSSDQECSAWGDVDNDGDLDVVIGPLSKELLINNLDSRPGFGTSRLRVLVLDTEGRRTSYGATVRLKQVDGPPGTTQTRVVDGGSGYVSQGEYTVQFGGVGTGRYDLEVIYPSPAGYRIVVDGLWDPRLSNIEPGLTNGMEITVLENGDVHIRPDNQITGVAPVPAPWSSARLGPPSPSPARRSTSIPVIMADAGNVVLNIYDLHGRLMRQHDVGSLPAGRHPVQWDLIDQSGDAVAPGVYFCRLLVDGRAADTRRLLVVR